MKNLYLILILSLLFFSCEDQGTEGLNSTTSSTGSPKTVNSSRPYSASLGSGMTDDYINTNRVIWQKPDMIINMLGDIVEKKVVDVGAGTGYFSLRLAKKADHVIALDIDPRFTNYLDSIKILELPDNQQGRLEARLTTPDDPKLRENETDFVIIVNTYMYLDDRIEYLRKLRKGVREEGKILIVDFKKKRTPIGPPSEIRVPLYKVEEELYEAGFKNVQTFDTALDYQYIVIARR